MRISAPITVSALVVAGLVATGSAAPTTPAAVPSHAPEALLAAAAGGGDTPAERADAELSRTVGLLPVSAEPPRRLTAMTPADGSAPFAGTVPLQNISLPAGAGAFGIPEIVLAAYRNAELALQSSMPNCGLHWSLLAGIGRIESGHAAGGHTDAAGTTVAPIYGPALDGTLPGNEVIRNTDGSYVRAIGPMQFLPSTWAIYGADAKGDGRPDPNNVFDATLAAGKYLCSGGLDLRDPAQELRAVLRYNNSTTYAANVLSWAAAYRNGGVPTQVRISPDLIPNRGVSQLPDMSVVSGTAPTTTRKPPPASVAPAPTEIMINIPGLPPIPCGIFCPPPPKPVNPCDPPAPVLAPGAPGEPPRITLAPGQTYGATKTGPNDPQRAEDQRQADQQQADRAGAQAAEPGQPQPDSTVLARCPAPQPADDQSPQTPEQTPGAEQESETPQVARTPDATPPEPAPTTTATPPPAITLPGGFVIPLPAPQG
ncbi:lytic transglycosylase [Nocardia panacis]|uniref:Lytic transglycosylase n=1 Tax=Nocardia panacis TaxID=2340916 RepID=A0A3A4K4Z0_9NOCA|nr:lytic murein transglycosylase [Nocardia panacis]RJO80364.1 lytic transglycosylase [Nocardia panacis]